MSPKNNIVTTIDQKPFNTHRALVLFVESHGGTLQGDPDRANDSRVDPETGHATVTPASLKRKIRDQIELLNPGTIYVRRGSCFERTDAEICQSVGIEPLKSVPEGASGAASGDADDEAEDEDGEDEEETDRPKGRRGSTSSSSTGPKRKKPTAEEAQKFYKGLSSRFTDARLFGQTVTSLQGHGVFRGPIQVSMGVSIDPVNIVRDAITRCAVTTLKEETKHQGVNRTMGRRSYVPYALYRFHIFANPYDARVTGCTEADYNLFLSLIPGIFDNDRSSARPRCAVQALYEIRYKDGVAAVNAERTLQRITAKSQVEKPRSFADYKMYVPPSFHHSDLFTFRSLIENEDDERAAAE